MSDKYINVTLHMKSQLVIIFLLLISTQANSQNKIGIEVNPYYMTNAKSKSWSFYLSPPLFSGNTLRYQLAQDLKGRVRQIPPNFFLFDPKREAWNFLKSQWS